MTTASNTRCSISELFNKYGLSKQRDWLEKNEQIIQKLPAHLDKTKL